MDQTNRRLTGKIAELVGRKEISTRSKVVYVDDGSRDGTWERIEGFADGAFLRRPYSRQGRRTVHGWVVGIKLAHNVGHQNALMAGMMFAISSDKGRAGGADAVVTIDADLQDDVDAIDKMLAEFKQGAEVVYGVRSDRKTDSGFKRGTAQGFYKLMKFLGVEMIYNAADFRLMSRRAVEELAKYEEVNLFLRGIVPRIGLKTAEVRYKRGERIAGESKYPFRKMLHFAWDGVTSFSVKPIRMIFVLGLLIFLLSVGVTAYSIVRKLTGNTVSGWTFIACSIWVLGGLQMVAIGLVGEYIGKIYIETKRRPKWVVEKVAGRAS